MKKALRVEHTTPGLWLDTEITYAQVPNWFGHTTRDLKLSIIRHQESTPGPAPLLVWICGGGYYSVDKNAHLAEFAEFAKQGYVIASPEYRTLNHVHFPAQLEDVKAAIRFLRAHADRYGINPNRVGVMGESAGGHASVLVGLTGEDKSFDKGDHLDQSSAVQAVCDWYGVTDATLLDGFADGMIGADPKAHPALAQKTNALAYVTEKAPPFLILHGDQDTVVPLSQSDILYEKLQSVNVPVEYYVIEGANHATIEFFQPPVKEIMIDFFDRHLKGEHRDA